MKHVKWFLVCILAVILSVLCGCSRDVVVPPDKSGNESENAYDSLQKQLDQSYGSVTMRCTVRIDGTSYLGSYTIEETEKGIEVTFSRELPARFSIDGDMISAPDEVKYTESGNAVFKDGQIVEYQGTYPDFVVSQVTLSRLKIKEEYFTEAVFSDGLFSAKVADASGFYGVEGANNMTVEISRSQSSVKSVSIAYATSVAQSVTVQYTVNE